MKRFLCPAVAILFCMLAALRTHAAVIVHTGPGKVKTDENLLFGSPPQIGTTVTGFTQKTNFLFDITSTSIPAENLITPSAGQSRVEAVDGAFQKVTLTPKSPTFGITALLFDIDALQNGNLTLDIAGVGFTPFPASVSLKKNGANWFGLEATNGDFITSVTLTSPVVGMASISQIRLSGDANINDGIEGGTEFEPVPEPGTLLLWGVVGIGGIGTGWLRRRRQA